MRASISAVRFGLAKDRDAIEMTPPAAAAPRNDLREGMGRLYHTNAHANVC